MTAHTLSVIGLFLNGGGALILVLCPSPIREVTEDGRIKYPDTHVMELSFGNDSKIKSWRYYWQQYGFRIGAGSLVVGFVFQFFAELGM